MRFWDRITGGAATVTVELDSPIYMPGETISVRATVSANGEFEAKSALVRLRGEEEVRFEVPEYDDEGKQTGEKDDYKRSQTVEVQQRIPGPIAMTDGHSHTFETTLTVPYNAPPTYAGPYASHTYKLAVELDVAWSANPGASVDVVIGLRGPE